MSGIQHADWDQAGPEFPHAGHQEHQEEDEGLKFRQHLTHKMNNYVRSCFSSQQLVIGPGSHDQYTSLSC